LKKAAAISLKTGRMETLTDNAAIQEGWLRIPEVGGV